MDIKEREILFLFGEKTFYFLSVSSYFLGGVI